MPTIIPRKTKTIIPIIETQIEDQISIGHTLSTLATLTDSSTKADIEHLHTIDEINELNSLLDQLVDSQHTHTIDEHAIILKILSNYSLAKHLHISVSTALLTYEIEQAKNRLYSLLDKIKLSKETIDILTSQIEELENATRS